MPPPHLAVLNAQEPPTKTAKHPASKPEGKPARGRLGWLRSTVTPPAAAPQIARPKPPMPEAIIIESLEPAPAAAAFRPQRAPQLPRRPIEPILAPRIAPAALRATILERAAPVKQAIIAEQPARPAERRAPQEDLLADLPPAQVALKITFAPPSVIAPAMVPASPAVAPQNRERNAAAERAFRIGRLGSRPAHAMSAAEVAAWREGAMAAGRARDSLWGRPKLLWWLALSSLLVMPISYVALWLGLASSGAEFLSTGLGQEAWMIIGGPEAGMVYWAILFGLAMLLQMLRPLEPVLILGAASYWGWLALHAAWQAGLLAQRIPPLPMPG